MSSKKKKIKKNPKKYLLEVTSKSIVLWGSGLFLLLVWIFILGVLVGRGHLSYDIMKDKFAKVQEVASEKGTSELDLIGNFNDDPKFAFYEELATRKEEVKQREKSLVKKPTRTKSYDRSSKKTADKKTAEMEVRQYILQIGSFRDKAKATALVERLSIRGYPAYASKANIDGESYYRVKCGPFNSENKADDFKKVLASKENIHGFVTRAGN